LWPIVVRNSVWHGLHPNRAMFSALSVLVTFTAFVRKGAHALAGLQNHVHRSVSVGPEASLTGIVNTSALEQPVLSTGSSICLQDSGICSAEDDQCQGGTLIKLRRLIGVGIFSDVFLSDSKHYAVKVATRKSGHFRNKGEGENPSWVVMKYDHECDIMRDLKTTTYMKLPDCKAVCQHRGHTVLVMGAIHGAAAMSEIMAEDYDMYGIARQVYESLTGMLKRGILNVDQGSDNILVDKSSNVYFIDFGQAERVSEIKELCNDTSYSDEYANFQELRDLGTRSTLAQPSSGCMAQIGVWLARTAFRALSALPASSYEAMSGLTDAFCANPHAKLKQTKYWRIYGHQGDVQFSANFRRPATVQKVDGTWIKVSSKPIIVSRDRYGRSASYDIPTGSTLAAVTCRHPGLAEYISLNVTNFQGTIDDICTGWYYFVNPDMKYIETTVARILRHSKHAPDLLAKMNNCTGRSS